MSRATGLAAVSQQAAITLGIAIAGQRAASGRRSGATCAAPGPRTFAPAFSRHRHCQHLRLDPFSCRCGAAMATAYAKKRPTIAERMASKVDQSPAIGATAPSPVL
jgi:hypothetical protein